MLHHGRLKLCAPLDTIKTQHRRVVLRFSGPRDQPPTLPGAIRINGAGREWTAICDAARTHPAAMAASIGATVIEDVPASLDEIFVAHAAR